MAVIYNGRYHISVYLLDIDNGYFIIPANGHRPAIVQRIFIVKHYEEIAETYSKSY